MPKWVAANEMVMVRVENPKYAKKIIIAGMEDTFEPQGVVVSMGHKAIAEIGEQFINETVRFIPQMKRDAFGDEGDEFFYVLMPYGAILAVSQDS